jgi:hypothetical protein
MKPSTALTFAAIVAGIFALLMLALPAQVLEGFGAPPHADGIIVAREVGGLYLGLAWLFLAGRKWTGSPQRTAFGIGILSQLTSTLINTVAVATGQIGAAALPGVAIHLIVGAALALGLWRARNG